MAKTVNQIVNLEVIQDVAALNKEIKLIAAAGVKLEARIWRAMLSCGWHIKQDNQTTPLNTLLESMGKGMRVNACRAYAETFFAVEYDTETKKMKFKRDKTTDLAGAARKSPFEFKPEPDYKPLNLPEALRRLLTQAEKHAETGDPRDLIPSDMLIKLRSLVPVPAE